MSMTVLRKSNFPQTKPCFKELISDVREILEEELEDHQKQLNECLIFNRNIMVNYYEQKLEIIERMLSK